MRNRKYIIRYRKRKNNRIRRSILIIFVSMFIFLFLFSSINVKAGEDDYIYSNYLASNELTIDEDPAQLLKTVASSGNNYRNLFYCPKSIATSIITPFVFSYYSDTKALYTFNQFYLDELNNEYSFAKSERIYSKVNNTPNQNQQFQMTKGTIENNATLDKLDNNDKIIESQYRQLQVSGNPFYLVPNSDIATNWYRTPASGYWYDKIDEYPAYTTSDGIYEHYSNEIETLGMSTLTITQNVDTIRVYFYLYQDIGVGYSLGVQIYDGTTWQTEKYFNYANEENYVIGYVEFTGLNFDQTKINNLQVRLDSETIPNIDLTVAIATLWVACYYPDDVWEVDYINAFQLPNSTLPIDEDNHLRDYTFYYADKVDVSLGTGGKYNLSIYNFSSNSYKVIDLSISTSYSQQSYLINSNFYNSTKYVKFKIHLNATNNLFHYRIDTFYVNITTFTLNDTLQGYQIIAFNWLRYTSGDVAKGNNEIGFKIYRNYVDFFYYEESYTYGTYDTGWYNFCNMTFEVNSLDIRVHARYGLDTLGASYKICYKIELTFNDNESLYYSTVIESYWALEAGYYLKQTINTPTFYSVNNNYERYKDLMFGNYSLSSLYGIRFLLGTTLSEYNAFFEVPSFKETIDVSELYNPSASVEIEGEPSAPKGSSNYWTYTSFRLISDEIIETTVGNWTLDYQTIIPEEYTAKFYYTEKMIDEESWGNWVLRLGDWKISFNFLRDAIVYVLNLLMLMVQYFLYFLTAAFSFLILFIGCWIITFLFNIVLYWIFIALIWVLWYLYLGLYWLLYWIWQGLIWVYENLIIPFGRWLYQVFLPLAIEAFIKVWAFLLTCLIYLITLGEIDFWDTYDTIYTLLHTIADFLFTNMIIVLNDLPALFIGIVLYLLLLCLCYLKYIYAKARGYKERAETLYSSLMVYLIPITYTYAVIRKIYESIPTAGGGGGESEQ